MQLVNVNNTEYLFRIASVGGKPRLVYQEVGSNNVNDIHIVSPKSAQGAPLDVVRYAVMVDEEDVNCVYIALVTADYDGTTEYTARANSTRMFGLTWDVSGHKSTESFLVPKEKGNEIQNPMVTGTDGHCVPVWYQKGLGLCWYNNQTKEQYRTSANSGNLLLTGKVEPGKAMYFLVRANGSSLMLRGFDCYGKATQETITLPLSTPLTWTGPMISASCVSEGFVYFIIGSHFFMYSTYNGSISEAHWLSESGQYLEGDVFDGIGGSEACQLVIAPGSNDDTYGCLIQLTPDTKLETVTGENNTIDYVQTLTGYTVSNFFFTKSTGRLRVTEPETYQLVDPNSNETVKPISSFCATAHYNGSKNAVESVQLLYTVPNTDTQSNVRSCDVYSWTHTLTDGVQAESISPRKDLISKNDSYFYVEATVRNTTSGRNVEHLLLSAKDEQNRSILFLPEGGGVLPEVYAVDHVIAPGMASTLGFWLRIPNEWEQGAHTITLSACVNNNTNSRTNENDWVPLTTLSVASDPALTMDVDLSYPVDANGQQKITGHVTITNLSMNPASFEGLQLVVQNGKNNPFVLKDFSGLSGSVTDASQTGGVWLNHSYNLSVDLTGRWGDADYIALYLTSTSDTLTDAQKASLIQRTKVILETPTPDVYTHVGTTSLAVVDDHTLQLTLRGSALVLTAWGGTDVSTPTPTPGPVSDHPEIGEAIRNGTWGVDESTPAPATQAPAAASSGAAGGSGTKPKATATPSSTPVPTVAPAPSDSSADSASPAPSSAPSDVVEPTSPEQNPSPSPAGAGHRSAGRAGPGRSGRYPLAADFPQAQALTAPQFRPMVKRIEPGRARR